MITQQLTKYGIDFDRGLQNCMGNMTLYKKILSMFLSDTCFSKAKTAYRENNREALFGYLHELKGISGNAALIELYNATVPLVELLRYDNTRNGEAAQLFSTVESNYAKACEGIRAFISE